MSNDNQKRYTIPDTLRCLEYIADSPPREGGGFHPQTVEIAKAAKFHIGDLQRAWLEMAQRLEMAERKLADLGYQRSTAAAAYGAYFHAGDQTSSANPKDEPRR